MRKQVQRVPATREEIAQAREEYQTDDIEIDDDAIVSRCEDGEDSGTWVSAWVWIDSETPAHARNETLADETGLADKEAAQAADPIEEFTVVSPQPMTLAGATRLLRSLGVPV